MKNYDCKQCKVAAERSIFLTGLFKKLSRSGKKRWSEATVLSRRMASAWFPTPGSTWDYLVTFGLSDGSRVELHTMEAEFQVLQEGLAGTLAWEGENLLQFDSKEG